MHTKILPLLALACIALPLTACGQPQLDAQPAVSSEASSPAQLDELAHPQPERPICEWCSVDSGEPPTKPKLTMDIHEDYVGAIDSVSFVAYLADDKKIFDLDQAVVDDLNSSLTDQTEVEIDEDGDIQRGLLMFDIGTETYYEPVRIF